MKSQTSSPTNIYVHVCADLKKVLGVKLEGWRVTLHSNIVKGGGV